MPQITSAQISKPILEVVLVAVAQGIGLNGTAEAVAKKAQDLYLQLVDQPGIPVVEAQPCQVPEYRLLLTSGLATMVSGEGNDLFLVCKAIPPSLIC